MALYLRNSQSNESQISLIAAEQPCFRVMSLFTMAFMGTVPLGSLLAGAISNQFGFHNMIYSCGAYCLVVAATFTYLLPRLREEGRGLYIQRGLLEAEEELESITKPNA